MTEPCGLDFLNKLRLQLTKIPSSREQVQEISEHHKGEWVGIQQLTEEISIQIGAPFTERKVGAILRNLGFTMRKLDASGKAQVLITPLTLETHLKIKAQNLQKAQFPKRGTKENYLNHA